LKYLLITFKIIAFLFDHKGSRNSYFSLKIRLFGIWAAFSRCIKWLAHPHPTIGLYKQRRGAECEMSKEKQGLSKYEVQRNSLNKMPVPDKDREEFAKEMVEDAKAAFGQEHADNKE